MTREQALELKDNQGQHVVLTSGDTVEVIAVRRTEDQHKGALVLVEHSNGERCWVGTHCDIAQVV